MFFSLFHLSRFVEDAALRSVAIRSSQHILLAVVVSGDREMKWCWLRLEAARLEPRLHDGLLRVVIETQHAFCPELNSIDIPYRIGAQ